MNAASSLGHDRYSRALEPDLAQKLRRISTVFPARARRWFLPEIRCALRHALTLGLFVPRNQPPSGNIQSHSMGIAAWGGTRLGKLAYREWHTAATGKTLSKKSSLRAVWSFVLASRSKRPHPSLVKFIAPWIMQSSRSDPCTSGLILHPSFLLLAECADLSPALLDQQCGRWTRRA